jgi:hypothetical protein
MRTSVILPAFALFTPCYDPPPMLSKLFGAGGPDHPMADPREARRLLDELSASDPLKALDELAHWHESVSATEGFRPEVRIQILFSLDESAQPRLRKVAREYLAAARPSRVQENLLWTKAHDYYRQCGHAYGRAIDSVLQGAKGADAAKPMLALLAVRALRALAQQIKWLHLRYGPVDPAVWRVLNGVYAFAESRDIGDAAVPAAYPDAPGPTSPREEFTRALALVTSSPDSLTPHELDLAERVIGDFAGSFVLAPKPAADLTHWTDLAQGIAPQRLARTPPAGPGLRYFGGGAALGALKKLIERIESTGQVPASLVAGAVPDPEGTLELLRRLLFRWSPVPPERKHPRHNVRSRLSIVHGYQALLAVLGGTGSEPNAEPAENWIVENVSAGGFGAIIPQRKGDWLKIGVLLGMQPEGGNNWVAGMIRRVGKTSSQEARIGIQTLSRAPELARFSVRGREETGVLLPAYGHGSGEAWVALRSGVFTPGQNLESRRGGRSYVYMPQGVAEHGDDYDILRFRELLRED